MHIDLQAELMRKYPLILRATAHEDDRGPIDAWGIECGDGWLELINRMLGRFEEYINELIDDGVAAKAWPRVTQLKEKLGTLRLYLQSDRQFPSWITDVLKQAENESATTCEHCGRPGRLHKEGYWMVICDQCLANADDRVITNTDAYLQQLEALLRNRTACD